MDQSQFPPPANDWPGNPGLPHNGLIHASFVGCEVELCANATIPAITTRIESANALLNALSEWFDSNDEPSDVIALAEQLVQQRRSLIASLAGRRAVSLAEIRVKAGTLLELSRDQMGAHRAHIAPEELLSLSIAQDVLELGSMGARVDPAEMPQPVVATTARIVRVAGYGFPAGMENDAIGY